jgi:hypothetical protein
MARVEILESLYGEIEKKFKKEAEKVFKLLKSLEENSSKGKTLGIASGLTMKELKYKSFRFYFITDGFKIKCLNEEDLIDLLIKFVRMSDKKSQQKTINEIKTILQILGPKGFT